MRIRERRLLVAQALLASFGCVCEHGGETIDVAGWPDENLMAQKRAEHQVLPQPGAVHIGAEDDDGDPLVEHIDALGGADLVLDVRAEQNGIYELDACLQLAQALFAARDELDVVEAGEIVREMEAELLVDVDKKEPTRVASSRGQAGRSGLHLDGFRRVWHRVLHSPPLKTGLSRPLRQSVGEKRYAENPSADPGSQ